MDSVSTKWRLLDKYAITFSSSYEHSIQKLLPIRNILHGAKISDDIYTPKMYTPEILRIGIYKMDYFTEHRFNFTLELEFFNKSE